MATMRKLTRLAFIAQQFGYEYADVWQGSGPRGNGCVILIVPDPSPQARARAAQNWARYPGPAGSARPRCRNLHRGLRAVLRLRPGQRLVLDATPEKAAPTLEPVVDAA